MEADPWIPMRTRLADEPATLLICDRVGIDTFGVVGRLHAIWSWAGEHTDNGDVPGATLRTVDRVASCEGFGAAMAAVDWIEEADGGIRFKRWDKHNSKCSKARKLAARRQAKKRWRDEHEVTQASRDSHASSHKKDHFFDATGTGTGRVTEILKYQDPDRRPGVSKNVQNRSLVRTEKRKRKPGDVDALAWVTDDRLRDTAALLDWITSEASKDKPLDLPDNEATRVLVLAIAERALKLGDNPTGLFKSLVAAKKWRAKRQSFANGEFDDLAAARLKAYHRQQQHQADRAAGSDALSVAAAQVGKAPP